MREMNKPKVWWPLGLSLTLILGMWTGFSLSKKIPEGHSFWKTPRKTSVQEVIDLLEKKYVDPLSTDSLSEAAIMDLLGSLDPHTIYIPPVHTAMAEEELRGNFEGIGVEYFIIDDTVHAIRVLRGGPSEKSGLKTGDKFLKVGDSVVAGNRITNEKIRRLLRGESGTQVSLEFLRGKDKKKINITRGTIPRPAVDAAYMINGQTGFLHLDKFSQNAYEEMMAAMEKLQKEGMKKMILDLRGNSGGILDEAIQISDEFLEGNRLVLYTEGTHSPRTDYTCKRPGLFEKGDLYILVDETSASASEVIAGAIQDWDRGTLIGRRTFGKGLVQEPFALSNGAQLRLTVSRFYTPSGRNIQKPFGKGMEDYDNEVFHRMKNGTSADAAADSNAKAYKTLIRKRTVYGGGGITTDFFIPFDSVKPSHPYDQLFSLGSINKTMYTFLMEQQITRSQFRDADDYSRNFKITPSLLAALNAFLKRQGMNMETLSDAQRNWIEKRLKSVIALHLWHTDEFYRIHNAEDAFVQKALLLAK